MQPLHFAQSKQHDSLTHTARAHSFIHSFIRDHDACLLAAVRPRIDSHTHNTTLSLLTDFNGGIGAGSALFRSPDVAAICGGVSLWRCDPGQDGGELFCS